MIEVRSVSKFFGNKKAVRDLSFTIHEGEIIGLLGLNGAGKSTILKILGCFLEASQGDAWVGGHSVAQNAQAVRSLIGYLPDKPPLYEEMKTRAYLEFVARLKNVSANAIPQYVDDAMRKTNLLEVSDVSLGELSHGYQQRVGIAQALVHKPKILILDEPINGLDPVQIIEMRDLILSLKGQHTVILSSHILSEITKTCDRILVIDKGQLVAEGSESQLRGKAPQGIHVRLELARSTPELVKALRGLSGVLQIDESAASQGFLDISCSHDIRPLIAQTVVQENGELLSMGRKEAELETLFFKLVKGGV